jgi:hypothetical protein
MRVWSMLDCSGETSAFEFADGGVNTSAVVGHSASDPAANENLIAWIAEEWNYSPSIVALTSLTYDTQTGEIVDADIEINDARFDFSMSGEMDRMDILNTVVHETGHFLGLDHSLEPEATMFASAPAGERTKRTLHQDDIEGFCAMYGADSPDYYRRPVTPTDTIAPLPADKAVDGCSSQNGTHSWGAQSVLFGVFTIFLLSMQRHSSLALMLLAYLVVSFSAPQAKAFKLYTTDVTGEPLRWFVDNAEITFDDGNPGDVDRAQARQVVMDSFNTWSELPCEDEAKTQEVVPFVFVDGGFVSGREVGHDASSDAANENLVIWVQSGWLHGDEVLALTSLTYDTVNGQIVDADLELNDDKEFAFQPAGQQYDVANTVVHEVGHFLGLDHSSIQIATMFSQALPSETEKRDLTQDDRNGYCALYGPLAAPIPVPEPVRSNSGCGAAVYGDAQIAQVGLMVICGLLLCGLSSQRWD